MKLFLISSVIALSLVSFAWCDDAPVIELQNGKVKGEEKESRDDRDFYAYRGIPYAKPPLGELRFEAPQKPDNWTGVWDGEDYGKKCIQWSTYEKEVDGDENCLFINVFTPKIGDGISKTLLPVLVYIHGGEFMTGTAEIYRAHYFMDQNVVVATFNYRLGAFGFLSTDDSAANGNAGLKDQVMALQWIQENIRKFGGDPRRVTIFGQGSGAISVNLLMLAPTARGLFKKAISQSGTAIQYKLQTRPLEAAQRLGRKLKCDQVLTKNLNGTGDVKLEDVLSNTTLLVDCLKLVKAKKIAEVHEEAFGILRHPLSQFIPTVEKPLKHHYNDSSERPFLTEHPFSLMLTGQQAKIPWMVGFNEQEGLVTTGVILNDKTFVSYLEDHWDELSSQLLSYPRSRTDLTKRIKKYYLSAKDYEFDGNGTSASSTTPRPVVPLPQQPPHAQHLNSLTANRSRPLQNQIHHVSPTIVPTQQTTTTASPYGDDDEDQTINFEEQFKSFTNLFTDRYFLWPIFEAVRLQLQVTSSRIYAYENLYEGQNTLLDVYTGKSKEPAPAMKKVKNWFKTNILGRKAQAPKHMGVCFGDELPLLFKYPDLKIKENTKDYEASKELVKLWAQFATDDTKMVYHNRTWTPVNGPSGNFELMRFHNVPEQSGMKEMSETLKKRLQFWGQLEHLAPFNQ